MKALSLRQPWASLIALGRKRVETRSWRPPAALLGQRIAIHATARPVDLLGRELLYRAGVDPELALTCGAIVATARLFAAEKALPLGCLDAGWILRAPEHDWELEKVLGDWTRGRWLWALDEIRAIEPVPCRGAQGLWSVPAEIAAAIDQSDRRTRP